MDNHQQKRQLMLVLTAFVTIFFGGIVLFWAYPDLVDTRFDSKYLFSNAEGLV
jgi:hypothetical protein